MCNLVSVCWWQTAGSSEGAPAGAAAVSGTVCKKEEGVGAGVCVAAGSDQLSC